MLRIAWAIGLVGLLTAAASADPELTGLDRAIRKEPVYQTKAPKYCLLAFGPEARTRVWLVQDGDTVYVDRNGDGDLTEEGESAALPDFKPSDHPFFDGEREVKLGTVRDGGRTHTELKLSQVRFRKVLGQLPPGEQANAAEWKSQFDKVRKQLPGGISDMISVKVAGPDGKNPVGWFAWVDHEGFLRFGDSPKTAPVVRFGGPLTMLVNPDVKIRPDPGPDENLTVHIGSAGVGAGSFAYSSYDGVPEDLFPVVEIEFPAPAGGEPVRERHELKQRC